VLCALRDQFVSAGHQVSTISLDELGALPPLIKTVLFPFYVAYRLARDHSNADVIEAATGDAWLYYVMRRRNRKTAYATISHGLYRPLHDRRMAERAKGITKVSWKYWLFRGSVELWQEALSMRVADMVYVLNSEERRFCIDKLGIKSPQVKLVKNGLGAHFLQRAAQLRRNSTTRLRTKIVQVGSYEERKGVRASVAATTQLLLNRPSVQMAYFGTVSPVENTHGDFPETLHARVRVVPRFNNLELPNMLTPYDIFIMPSIYEGFGIAPYCGTSRIYR
jgi:glycosyltransferase involved in cell wall biosynthesis